MKKFYLRIKNSEDKIPSEAKSEDTKIPSDDQKSDENIQSRYQFL